MRSGKVMLSLLVFTLGVAPLGWTVRDAVALDVARSSPVYSYFEGLRGRLPLWIPATPDDPLSIWINPASLGTGQAGGLGYLHTYSRSTISGDNAFVISMGSLAFGAEFMTTKDVPTSPSRRETHRYTVAMGQRLYKGVYTGSSYSWHRSEISEMDKASTWSAGLLVRPHRMLSAGLVGRDLNSPTYYGNKFKPIIETSLGFRPAGGKLMVFVNYLARGKEMKIPTYGGIETQPKSFFTYGVEIEPLRGIVLRIGSDKDENISTSVSLLIGNAGLGSLVTRERAEKGEEKTYGTAVITVSPFWHENVLMPRNGYLEIDMSGTIGEVRQPLGLMGGAGPRYTLRELLQKIDRAKRSPEVRAIVLRCSGVSSNFAILDELRQALIDFRSSGKKVIAYTEESGNGEYYLASAADYIIIIPSGYVGLVGLKSEMVFLRGTLEKLGVEAKYTRVGKYKSAVEPLTEDQFTEPSREAENALLDDIYAKFVRDIAQGRNMTDEKAREAVDNGPYIPSEAVAAGLVDTIAYWDEVPAIVRRVLHAGTRAIPYGAFAARNYGSERWGEPPTIGIVYALGAIDHGANRDDMLFGEVMGSDTMTRAIKAMREDPSVRAVVLRVDSPGGVMSASDLIRREIELTRKKKPVIVSMGGAAASGGYHIACSASKILADEGTVTGSIGVLNLWFHTRGLYQKIGVNKEIMTRGKHADPMPSWRDVTEDDMKLMQYLTDKYYGKFVANVSEGRGVSYEDINDVAQGRVWSGKAALGIGLVDRIGGLKAAIELAKEEAGIPRDEDVRFKVLPKAGGFVEKLVAGAQAKVMSQVRIPEYWKDLLKGSDCVTEFDEPFLYLAPYTIEIK